MIFETMSRLSALVDLNFSTNQIKGLSGPIDFFKAIGSCGRYLQRMRVKTCTFGGIEGPAFEKAFRECFGQLTSLKVLNLSYSSLSDGLAKNLAESVPAMNAIERINLKQCNLTSESIDIILEKLSCNGNDPTLVSLNLSGNNLAGIAKMGKFLSKNNSSGTLEQLKLANCKLGDAELK